MFIRDEDGSLPAWYEEEEILESFLSHNHILHFWFCLSKTEKIRLLGTIIRIAINEMIPSKTIICQESYDTKNFLIYEGIWMERLRDFDVFSCDKRTLKTFIKI